MNERDDLDRRLMAWLDDPYPPPAPAYLGAVLERTRRTQQRRSWASLERWLPMTITLRRPMLAPSMRLIAVGLALIVALLAAVAAVPVLSRLGLFQGTVAVPWHNGLIAFSRAGDIWVVDPKGGDPKLLIGGSQAVDDGPDWSPDGRQIAFWRTVGGATSLMVADANGSNIRQVTKAPLSDPQGFWWSPDGSRFAIPSTIEGQPGVSLVNADGTNMRQLMLVVPVTDASWTPDGTSLLVRAYTSEGTTLYPVSVAGGTLGAPIIRSDSTSAFYAGDRGIHDLMWPSWSPDGSRIAYTQGVDLGPGHRQMFGGPNTRNHVLDANGSNDRVIEYAVGSDDEDGATWSPDGTRLSMVIRTGNDHQVAIATVDGSAATVATSPEPDPAGLYSGWSPDGTVILTVRDADGVAAFVDPTTGTASPVTWLGGAFDWQPVAANR